MQGSRAVRLSLAALGASVALLATACVDDAPPSTTAPVTELVSLAGEDGGADVYMSAGFDMTPDGRHVAFVSTGMTFDGGPAHSGVYVRDTVTGEVEQVGDTGQQPLDGGLPTVSISADGNLVAYSSTVDGLVHGDTNGVEDVFVFDRATGATERISVSTEGDEADGRSHWPSMSADGRHVAFTSEATNLDDGPVTSSAVFVHHRALGVTTRVSVDSDGSSIGDRATLPAISGDGSTIAFYAYGVSGYDDVDGYQIDFGDGPFSPTGGVFVHELDSGGTSPVSVGVSLGVVPGPSGLEARANRPAISADGRFVSFPLDVAEDMYQQEMPMATQIALRDRQAGTTELIAPVFIGYGGNYRSWRGHPSVSDNGRHVAFVERRYEYDPEWETNHHVEDVFRYDRTTGMTLRVSTPAEGMAEVTGITDAWGTELSSDGRYVAYATSAPNQIPGGTSIMLPNGTTTSLSNVFRRGPSS